VFGNHTQSMADPVQFDLSGRTAPVTGAGRRVGFALASGLGRARPSPVFHAGSEPRLKEALAELLKQDLDAKGMDFDVTIPEQIKAGVAAVKESVGPIKVLVNNAAIQHRRNKGVAR